jgi:hypothetical protein
MITAYVTYKDNTVESFTFDKLSVALNKVRTTLEVGDSFVIREGKTLLAKGKIENYKEKFYEKKVR